MGLTSNGTIYYLMKETNEEADVVVEKKEVSVTLVDANNTNGLNETNETSAASDNSSSEAGTNRFL